MNITSDDDGQICEPSEIEYSGIGTVKDGQFVLDEKAFKLGFLLYF